jgi:hypothetical protein
MPNLQRTYEIYEKAGGVLAYKMGTTRLWRGGLVCVDANGLARSLDPAVAILKFIGIAEESADNTAGTAGGRTVRVAKTTTGVYAANGFSPTLADLGKEVYAASDWEVRLNSTGLANPIKVGTIVGIEIAATGQAGVRVRIDHHTN